MYSVVAFDIGIRTLSFAVVHTKSEGETAQHIALGEKKCQHITIDISEWQSADLLPEAEGSAQNQKGTTITLALSDYMSNAWPIINAHGLNAIIVEEQPFMEFNQKMRQVSFTLLGILRTYTKQYYEDMRESPPLLFWYSGKVKMSIVAPNYRAPPRQQTLDQITPLTNTGENDFDVIPTAKKDKQNQKNDVITAREVVDIEVDSLKSSKSNSRNSKKTPRQNKAKSNPNYGENKQHAVTQTELFLQENPKLSQWLNKFVEWKKNNLANDPADAFMHARYHIEQRQRFLNDLTLQTVMFKESGSGDGKNQKPLSRKNLLKRYPGLVSVDNKFAGDKYLHQNRTATTSSSSVNEQPPPTKRRKVEIISLYD